MPEITIRVEVVYPMGPKTRALCLDDPDEARRLREWWREHHISTRLSTATRGC
jgi:hypothetical protein